MSDLTRGERLQIMLTQEELKALDDWRFSRRMPSRASAVRELLKRGLASEGFLSADQGSKSQSFGVTAGGDANGAAPKPKLDESP
jgi:metal-responsive CopG/Arc/MetJ family transcriptional regulator